jgi:hypothetical protein
MSDALREILGQLKAEIRPHLSGAMQAVLDRHTDTALALIPPIPAPSSPATGEQAGIGSGKLEGPQAGG